MQSQYRLLDKVLLMVQVILNFFNKPGPSYYQLSSWIYFSLKTLFEISDDSCSDIWTVRRCKMQRRRRRCARKNVSKNCRKTCTLCASIAWYCTSVKYVRSYSAKSRVTMKFLVQSVLQLNFRRCMPMWGELYYTSRTNWNMSTGWEDLLIRKFNSTVQ